MMYGACAWVQQTGGYTEVGWAQRSVPGWGDHRAHWGTGPPPLTEGSQRCAGVYSLQGVLWAWTLLCGRPVLLPR